MNNLTLFSPSSQLTMTSREVNDISQDGDVTEAFETDLSLPELHSILCRLTVRLGSAIDGIYYTGGGYPLDDDLILTLDEIHHIGLHARAFKLQDKKSSVPTTC